MNTERLKFLRKIDLGWNLFIIYIHTHTEGLKVPYIVTYVLKRLLIYSTIVSGIANVSEDELSGFTRRSP